MTRRSPKIIRTNEDCQIGEIVTVIGGEYDGISGELDNIFEDCGLIRFTVIFRDSEAEEPSEEFTYATAIRSI